MVRDESGRQKKKIEMEALGAKTTRTTYEGQT